MVCTCALQEVHMSSALPKASICTFDVSAFALRMNGILHVVGIFDLIE